VEQKNGVVVRQLIGYDRFEGQRAYRQLAELYRAVRLYINFFQPSMKLQNKQRNTGKVRRKYDTAKTPFKRLCATDVIEAKYLEKLDCVYQTLDPVRLLKQIKTLQDALWKHAILPKQPHQPQDPDKKNIISELHFHVADCTTGSSIQGNCSDKLVVDFEESRKRKYRKSKKSKIPRWWRTRKDPFEEVWAEVSRWLECNPERTSKLLLCELKKRYPEKYNDSHLRTLQRRVKSWRSKAIITFDDEWLHEEKISEKAVKNSLTAVVIEKHNFEQMKNDSRL
jgi:hypothetical protein